MIGYGSPNLLFSSEILAISGRDYDEFTEPVSHASFPLNVMPAFSAGSETPYLCGFDLQ